MLPSRTLLSAAFVLVAACDPAQAGMVPRFGFELAGNYATVSRTDQASGDEIIDTPFGLGFGVGTTAVWPVTARFAIVSGLRYAMTGETDKITFTFSGTSGPQTISAELRETWHWLVVPLRASFRPGSTPLSFEAGPEVAFLIQARSEWLSSDRQLLGSANASRLRAAPAARIFEDVGTFWKNLNVTDQYHRVNYVLGGGVSYSWPMATGNVTAHARYGYGLNDMLKAASVERHNQGFEAGVGWRW